MQVKDIHLMLASHSKFEFFGYRFFCCQHTWNINLAWRIYLMDDHVCFSWPRGHCFSWCNDCRRVWSAIFFSCRLLSEEHALRYSWLTIVPSFVRCLEFWKGRWDNDRFRFILSSSSLDDRGHIECWTKRNRQDLWSLWIMSYVLLRFKMSVGSWWP